MFLFISFSFRRSALHFLASHFDLGFTTEFAASFLAPAACGLDVALDIVYTVKFPGFGHCLRRRAACRRHYPLAPFVFAISPFSSPLCP